MKVEIYYVSGKFNVPVLAEVDSNRNSKPNHSRQTNQEPSKLDKKGGSSRYNFFWFLISMS